MNDKKHGFRDSLIIACSATLRLIDVEKLKIEEVILKGVKEENNLTILHQGQKLN